MTDKTDNVDQFAPGVEPYSTEPADRPNISDADGSATAAENTDSLTGFNVADDAPVSTEDLDMVFDWLNELGDGETKALFDLLCAIDPFERTDAGDFRWTDEQRKLLAEAKQTYGDAGFDTDK